MKLFKFPVITSDAIVADNYIWVDMSTLTEVTVGATTCVLAGSGWTVTCTTDGTNAAEKLLNANKLANYFVPIVLEYNGNAVHRSQSQSVYDVWSGLNYAGIESAVGLAFTGDTGPLVSVALS